MNTLEMSNEFDVLYNNIMSNQAPGIDEYEKSLFLTKAQEELLKAYFDPRGNKYMQGFDGSEKRQIDFSSVLKSADLDLISAPGNQFDLRSKVYKLPDDCFIIVNEQIYDTDENGDPSGYQYTVSPITYQEYSRQMSKPYKYPPKNIVWRIITYGQVGSNGESQCEIIGRYIRQYEDTEGPLYKIRYVKRPNPIILVDLSVDFSGLTIDNNSGPSACELDPILHHEIVQRAVELAVATYDPQKVNVMTGIGNVSSTNMGVIPQSNKD